MTWRSNWQQPQPFPVEPHPIQRGDKDKCEACGVTRSVSASHDRVTDHHFVEPIQRGEEMGTTGAICACPGDCEALCMVEPKTVCRVVRDHAVRQQPDPDAAVRAIFSRHQYRQGPWDADKCAEDGEESGTLCLAPRSAHTFEPQTRREREAFAAGRDEGAREEREEIRRLITGFEEDADFDAQELIDDINIEIARRSQVPK